MNRPKWFADSWGQLARSVLASAFLDLDPQGENRHINNASLKGNAIAFFENRNFRLWARAAGFSINDTEQAYLDVIGKEDSGGIAI